jgi:predicted amidophosphoribosyltransferase
MTDTGSQATRAAWTAWLGGSCEVCHGWCRARLCTHCRLQFASPRPRCLCCGLGLPDGVQRCGACLTDPPLFERCICSVDYAFPWDRLITRFKFKHAPELATVLVEGLVESARQTHAPAPEAFVPVPLSRPRLAERGYDQAWELARRLGTHWAARHARRSAPLRRPPPGAAVAPRAAGQPAGRLRRAAGIGRGCRARTWAWSTT